MKQKEQFPAGRRMDRMIQERVHDPYRTRRKLPDPSLCPQCGVVFSDGRWQWAERPAEAYEEVCPACRRVNDRYPAGEVTIAGKFLAGHRDEILDLARNQERQENGEHALHRIMDIEESDDGLLITTTDIHLPRRIGQKLFDAYEGDFDFTYDEEGYFVRVTWRRDD